MADVSQLLDELMREVVLEVHAGLYQSTCLSCGSAASEQLVAAGSCDVFGRQPKSYAADTFECLRCHRQVAATR
jgi:hypothetical protein